LNILLLWLLLLPMVVFLPNIAAMKQQLAADAERQCDDKQ